MAGTVLENLSTRKLLIFTAVLVLLEVISLLVGGLMAPSPTHAEVYDAVNCIDNNGGLSDNWFEAFGDDPCLRIDSLDEAEEKFITADKIVFSLRIPKRGRYNIRLFQYILAILELHVIHKQDNPFEDNSKVTLDIRLGYMDKGDKDGWKLLAKSTEQRELHCTFSKPKTREFEKYQYDCEFMPLFELGSCYHEYLLVNIRLPTSHHKGDVNFNIGYINKLSLITIHQNGGFSLIWYIMKTVFLPPAIGLLVWFWRRISILSRPPVLMERTILALGLGLVLLDLPLEWFTLYFDVPYMLLLSDIRQGIFYMILLSFWIIFPGEHLLDQVNRNNLTVYWKEVGAVVIGSAALFIFDMCERGVQLTNPFYSIWSADTGKHLALAFIILAGIAASVYFLFLCFMVFKVFRKISGKRVVFNQIRTARKLYYEGLIYRFKFLMLLTLSCAAITVIFFIISQVNQGQGHWTWSDNTEIQFSSAFFTGVFAMWNLYVFTVISMYAPSHKDKLDQYTRANVDDNTDDCPSNEQLGDTVELQHRTGSGEDTSVIYQIIGKAAHI